MPVTMREPTRQLGSHRQELAQQWVVGQVEELFVVRARLGFGQQGVALRGWVKTQLAVVVAVSCWLMV